MSGWGEALALLGAGLLSSWVPVVNSEVVLAGALAARIADPAMLVTSLAFGMAVGKTTMMGAVRAGMNLPFLARWRRRSERPRRVFASGWRSKIQGWAHRGIELVETPRWGWPMVAVSAAVGVPPLFATTLAAGATRMSLVGFAASCWTGLLARYVVVSLVVLGVIG